MESESNPAQADLQNRVLLVQNTFIELCHARSEQIDNNIEIGGDTIGRMVELLADISNFVQINAIKLMLYQEAIESMAAPTPKDTPVGGFSTTLPEV